MLLGPWQGLGTASKASNPKLGCRYTNGARLTVRSPAPRRFWQKTGVRAENQRAPGNGSDGDEPEGEGEANPSNGIPEIRIILRECLIAGSKINIKWHPALQMSLFRAVINKKKALRYDLKDEILLKHLCKMYIALILKTHAGLKMTRQEREALRGVVNGTRVERFNNLVWLVRFVELVIYQEQHGGLPALSHPEFGNWMKAQRRSYKVLSSDREAKLRMTPWRLALLGAWPEWQWNGRSQQSKQQQPKRNYQQRRRQLGNIRIFKIMQENPDAGSRWDSDFEKVRKHIEYYERLPPRNHALGIWCDYQRKAYERYMSGKSSHLTPRRITLLEALPGWKW